MSEIAIAGLVALGRLVRIAQTDTSQGCRVANFLLAWQNADANGGWDPVELWSVEDATATDILAVLHLLHEEHGYPETLGFGDELKRIGELWRQSRE